MKKKRIYIDNSSLNRPFDDYSHPKIKIEAMADYFITSDRKIIKNYNGALKIVLPNIFLESINI